MHGSPATLLCAVSLWSLWMARPRRSHAVGIEILVLSVTSTSPALIPPLVFRELAPETCVIRLLALLVFCSLACFGASAPKSVGHLDLSRGYLRPSAEAAAVPPLRLSSFRLSIPRKVHPVPHRNARADDVREGTHVTSLADGIGLNFIRPDVGRPGNHDFLNRGVWLVSQFKELGVRWNRLAFSWVLVEPEPGRLNWEPYDRIVEARGRAGISILATLGGHFDRPPVPTWAGASLAEVVRHNPGALERFLEAWVARYRGSIGHWEMLNEPHTFHEGLTVAEYVEGILKPGYRIVKAADAGAVLPCAFGQLPVLGDRKEFWEAARRSLRYPQ